MVKDLEVRAGATPSTSGSMKGSLNRMWTKIKSSITSGGVQHTLDDLAQEEADLKKLYETALSSAAIDSALNGVLNTHLKSIATHLSELRIICGEAKYGDKWDIATPSTGEVLKDKLSTAGSTVTATLQSTGQSISSAVSSSGVVIKDKLGYGQSDTNVTTGTTVSGTTDTSATTSTGTTTQHIKEQLVATGTVIKDNLTAAGTAVQTKFNEYTAGQDIKGQLAATGTVIKENLQAAGTVISDKMASMSLTGQSQNPTGDKLTTELQKTTPVEKPAVVGTGQVSTGDQTSASASASTGLTTADVKDKLQAAGTVIKDNLQAASTTVQDKLGVGTGSQNPTGDQLTKELQKTTSIEKPAVVGTGEGPK